MQVSATSPTFDDDIEVTKNAGPESDLLWQKQSFMCAKILLAENNQEEANTAFAIIHDLITDNTYSEEQDEWIVSKMLIWTEGGGGRGMRRVEEVQAAEIIYSVIRYYLTYTSTRLAICFTIKVLQPVRN